MSEDTVTWKINLTQMMTALSVALDAVTQEVVGVPVNHAKRVACICSHLGKILQLPPEDQFDLEACALLHDNAIPEYLATEYDAIRGLELGAHCVEGEKNMALVPLYSDRKAVILYHHEKYDGNGPFRKKGDEVPLFAALIHLADNIDTRFDLASGQVDAADLKAFLIDHSGRDFDPAHVNLLLSSDLEHMLAGLDDSKIYDTVEKNLMGRSRELNSEQVRGFALLFAAITDYKSSFTSRHSQGVANKVDRMALYYGVDELERIQLVMAGALHDIGKLVIPHDILEKPGRLTDAEMVQMKTHVYGTWQILQDIEGLQEVRVWAAHHHEKLDGSGYPFALKAEELSRNERLMACIDVYQAMTEERPYKPGFSHAEAMKELTRLAELGQLDSKIVSEIDAVFS